MNEIKDENLKLGGQQRMDTDYLYAEGRGVQKFGVLLFNK